MVKVKKEAMRIIIIAAGEATRWKNHLGVTKHYAPVKGVPIIERLVAQLIERNEKDVHVVSKSYTLKGVKNYRPTLNPDNYDADKFLSSDELWDTKKRTLIIYGDVYFSNEAINKVLNDKSKGYKLFCRPTEGSYGYPYGECFAISFYPEDIEKVSDGLHHLVDLYNDKVINRIGGWEITRVMAGIKDEDITKHREDLSNYIVIDDETNDIDFPEDYDSLINAINKSEQLGKDSTIEL